MNLLSIINATMAAHLITPPISGDYIANIYFKSNFGQAYNATANCDRRKECNVKFGDHFVIGILPLGGSYDLSLEYLGDDPNLVQCCHFFNGRSHITIAGTGETQKLVVKNVTPQDLAYHPSEPIGELSIKFRRR
ncbi:hypothetical protein AB6802_09470 [Mesorhizobium sp. RCC_202]|uniref:hypothetical protein n=1 Tax=Mesorhizobium sp. RCC_202 TaxID=3239222 RepID=UPI0035264317